MTAQGEPEKEEKFSSSVTETAEHVDAAHSSEGGQDTHCSTKASLIWMAARASGDTAVRPTIHFTCHTTRPNRPEALSTGTHCHWLLEVLLHTLKR